MLLNRVYLFPLAVEIGIGGPDIVSGCIPLFSFPFNVLQFVNERIANVCNAISLYLVLIAELNFLSLFKVIEVFLSPLRLFLMNLKGFNHLLELLVFTFFNILRLYGLFQVYLLIMLMESLKVLLQLDLPYIFSPLEHFLIILQLGHHVIALLILLSRCNVSAMGPILVYCAFSSLFDGNCPLYLTDL